MSASPGLVANVSICRPQAASGTPSSAHSVHFYEDDIFLVESLSNLVGQALVMGDAAIVIATSEHREELAKRLKERGLDLEVAAKQGRYCSLDAAETLAAFMVNGAPEASLFQTLMEHLLSSAQSAAKSKSSNLVLFGEMVALLWSQDNFDAALKLERLWNCLAQVHSFRLHCAYPMKSFNREAHSEAFLNICAEHSHVLPTENYIALGSEQDRLRHISLLQQKAQTAATEAAGRLRAEEALRRSEKLAAAGQLAAGIAHEINNPLESISNAIYLARSSPPSEIASFLRIADEELARVAQITRQTLGFYRETASPGNVRLSVLLNEVLALYNRKLEAKNVSVEKQYRDQGEIWAQAGELRQVFANQIANAIYAMPQNGRLIIRIRKSRSWNKGQQPGMAVSLVDTGSGISPEAMPRIFEPFFTTKQADGNGLGLWITHDIVTRHGGTIRARSNTRSGTIFTTFLPHHNDNPAAKE